MIAQFTDNSSFATSVPGATSQDAHDIRNKYSCHQMFTNLGFLLLKSLESRKQKIQCSTSYQMFFTPGILPCCRRIAFLISRPSALTMRIVIDYQMKIMFQWKWPSIYERYPYCFLPSLPRNENYSEIILKRNPNYVLPTLPRGGGTAFPISLCLSRIVPANSKSSLKVYSCCKKCKKLVQVVQNCKNVLLSPCLS